MNTDGLAVSRNLLILLVFSSLYIQIGYRFVLRVSLSSVD